MTDIYQQARIAGAVVMPVWTAVDIRNAISDGNYDEAKQLLDNMLKHTARSCPGFAGEADVSGNP